MRRKVGPVLLAAALAATAACGNGGDSTAEVCERIETEGTPALDRFNTAGQDLGAALQAGDEAAASDAATEAQSAGGEFVDLLRDGAEDTSDEELSSALDTLADEMEGYLGGLDVADLAAGQQPDSSGVDAAYQSLDEVCGA